MTVGSALFAAIVWSSIASVLAAFGYMSWLLLSFRRKDTAS